MKKIAFILVITLFNFSHFAQELAPYIMIDHFGYPTDAQKVAILVSPEEGFNSTEEYIPSEIMDPDQLIQLIDASTNEVVFSNNLEIWSNGQTHLQSGDKGYWFDFSSFQTDGTYYIYDPVSDIKSEDFVISIDPYQELIKVAGRMFYFNRCGMEKSSAFVNSNWTDDNNFLQDEFTHSILDPDNSDLDRDLRGGWFDAGDYNKYVTFANSAVHNLLWAYQSNPIAFNDEWNIPESGNNIPDILDEIKWELDWLEKMVDEEGGVSIKMGSISYNENANYLPSENTDPRYYGVNCTSSEVCAASMFAHAAYVFSEFSEFNAEVQQWTDLAELIWNNVEQNLINNNLEEGCDDGTILAGDADMSADEQRAVAFQAAVFLYAQTGNSDYLNYVESNINDNPAIGSGLWDNYNTIHIDAALFYANLPNANSSTANDIISTFQLDINNNWNGYFGEDNSDLYRAPMPDWSYHWGSNSPKAAIGILNQIINEYEVFSETEYTERALETLHYFHGVNPLNLCYLSNMGEYGSENSLNQIYHSWFHEGSPWDDASLGKGPAPGFVAGGANQWYEANTSLTPPYNQPLQKSYLDFNDGWPNNSWELSEPAIYYQANYLRLLSTFVSNDTTTDIHQHENSEKLPKVFPIPFVDILNVHINGLSGSYSIYNLNGDLVQSGLLDDQTEINTSTLPKGLYSIVMTIENRVHKKLISK